MFRPRYTSLRRTTARALLALSLLPTGPILGIGAVEPGDLGLRLSVPAPGIGEHVALSYRTTALALAADAARASWRRSIVQFDRWRPSVALLEDAARRLAAWTGALGSGTSDFLSTPASQSTGDRPPLSDLLPAEIPPPPTPPDANPKPLPGATAAASATRARPGTSVEPMVSVPVVPAFSLSSISWQPNDPSPGALFLPIQSAVRRVFAFDACDVEDPWKLWDPANPGASDLTSVTPAKGFWLEGVAEATLPEGGPEPVTTVIPLCLGWNLIGFPASSPRPVADALASIAGRYLRVFGFDPADATDPWEVHDVAVPAWANDLVELRPGRGYWIYVTEATTLEISNEDDLPFVSFAAPADLAEIAAPTPIVGTIRSPALANWQLAYRASDATDSGDWVELASGTTPLEAAALATFDPTLLENDLYELRLRAQDTAFNTTETSITLAVEGQRKIGHFALAFVDLEMAISGMPIQVIRTYDSRRRDRAGDFGFGWELGLKNGRYRRNRPTGYGWQIGSGFLPCDSPLELRSHQSTVRLSDAEIYRFRPILVQRAATLGGCFARLAFAFVDGPELGATLEVIGGDEVFWANGSTNLVDPESQILFDPTRVKLTTRDGRVFEVDRGFGVTRAIDPNGVSVVFSDSGIVHSDGVTIAFTRDGEGRITGIADPEGAGLGYAYDAAGDLVAFTDRTAGVTRFTYSAGHYLEEIEDPRGIRAIRTEYDADGRVVRHLDAEGREIAFDHRLEENREIVTNRLGGTRTLEYDARGNVTLEIDETGVATTRTFDGNDQLLTETDALGNTTSYAYDGQRNLVSTTDPLGHRTRFTYDTKGNVLTVTDPRGAVSSNSYDAKGNLLSTTDPLGHRTTYTYNAHGRPLTETDPSGATSTTSWFAWKRQSETDALGNTTSFFYYHTGEVAIERRSRTVVPGTTVTEETRYFYTGGRLLRTVAPDGATSETEYDAAGNVVAAIDPLGRRSELTYDDLGRHIRTDFPDGTFETSEYDAEGRRTSSTDRAGRTTRHEYDLAGRLLRTIHPDDSVVEQVYDAAGRLERTIDPRGHATAFAYDLAGRRTSITDALGRITRFAYDAAGNQTSIVDPRGFTTAFVHDTAGRLTRTIAPDATFRTTGYDALGRRISETDESGRTTRFGYDALGRLISVTDALGQITRYAYDEVGNRISQTDANGRVTRFEYDSAGRQSKRILPDGDSESFAYDLAGQRTARVDFRDRTTLYEYDAQGRLLRRTYPDGSTVAFTFSPTGRRLTATDPRGTTSYAYDVRDRITTLLSPDGRALSFAYDAAGNRTTLTADLAGRTLTTTFTYDSLDRLDTVTDPDGGVYDHAYDDNGNRESLLHPNGVATSYSYDARNRLTQISTIDSAGATLVAFAYTLSPTGNRTRITEHDGTTRHYAYDALYRLTDEHVRTGLAPDAPTAWRNTFQYDSVGNRTEQLRQVGAGAPQPVVSTYDTRDRLLTENGPAGLVDHGWDDLGNLVSRSGPDGATYDWDFENRLTRVTLANGTVVEHTYDADGTRVRTRTTPATGPPTTIDYLVDPWHQTSARGRGLVLSQVVAESDLDSSALTAYHVRGDDLLATLRPEAGNPTNLVAKYFHAEGIGTIRALTNEAGEVTDRYTLEAFGTLLSHEGDDPNAYLFAGEPLDPNSGFYYNRARWLQPQLSRFASQDPLLSISPLSAYQYAANTPANSTDPLGLFDVNISALNVAGAIGASIASIGFGKEALRRLSPTGIFVQAHEVIVGLPYLGDAYHMLIRFIPQDEKKWMAARPNRFKRQAGSRRAFATLGAGPAVNFPPFGDLVSDWNRDRDVSAPKAFSERIAIGRDEDQLIAIFEALDAGYADDLPYDAYPGASTGAYNSGSYIAGLLNAAGVALPSFIGANLELFPGAEKPVPPQDFGSLP